MPSPLCMTARSNRPSTPGEVRCPLMLRAPHETPNTVTFAGSPPNAAALRRTQRMAACWSCRPYVPDPLSPG